jgi:hypothetical protein
MLRYDNVSSYFIRITQIHDKLVSVGEKVEDIELANVALNGFTKSREPFVKGVYSQDKLPNSDKLWDDCI